MVSLCLTFAAAFALEALADQAADTTPAPVVDKIPPQVVTTIGWARVYDALANESRQFSGTLQALEEPAGFRREARIST